MSSLHRAAATLSMADDNQKYTPSSSKSADSIYSNTGSRGSANFLYARKNSTISTKSIMNRTGGFIPANNEVRQRVLSARRLRIKTYQNQLADAQQTIADLAHENRMLRTLHKRQDSALAKYESNNAELPQLLHSHAEELRVWQTKYRNLQNAHKELEAKLKQKEGHILTLSDQNRYYSQLSKDKNLEDRQRLMEKVTVLENRIQVKDTEMQMLVRKMKLDAKNQKQLLLVEQKKVKDMMAKLEKARMELSGYHKLEEINFIQGKASAPKPVRNKPAKRVESPKPELLQEDIDTTLDKAALSREPSISEDTEGSHRTVNSTRTVRKAPGKLNIAGALGQAGKLAAPQTAGTPKQRRVDIGDGDATSYEAKKNALKAPVFSAKPPKLTKQTTFEGFHDDKSDNDLSDNNRDEDEDDEHEEHEDNIIDKAFKKDENKNLYHTDYENNIDFADDEHDDEHFDGHFDEEDVEDDDGDLADDEVATFFKDDKTKMASPKKMADKNLLNDYQMQFQRQRDLVMIHKSKEDGVQQLQQHRNEEIVCTSAGPSSRSPKPFHTDDDEEDDLMKYHRLPKPHTKDVNVKAIDKKDTKDMGKDTGKPTKINDKNNMHYNKTGLKADVKASPGMLFKDDLSNIRKQISDDYKDREAFLDTFCRQASSSALRDEPPTPPAAPNKRNGIAFGRKIPPSRKNKLLAALKAIDDNGSQE